jgi:O-antigen/teichoic acid export membrane protein
MKASSKVILKNASVLFGTQLYTWVLAVLLTLILPRYLGAVGSGQLHLAASLWAIVGIVAAFGMDALVIKEVARDPNRASELLSTSIILRSLFFLFGSVVVYFYARAVQYPEMTTNVILIIGIANFFVSVGGALQSNLQGLERMEFTSLGTAIERTLATLGSIALLLLGFGVLQVALLSAISSLAGVLVLYFSLRQIQKPKLVVNFSVMKWMIKSSLPFLFTGAFIVIYGQIDTILISMFVDERGVGLYGVTDRLIGTLFFIPAIIITATGPALCRMFVSEPESFTQLLRRSFNFTILIAVPIGLGTLLIANSAVVLLFGDGFVDSGPILAVRGIVLIFAFLNTLIGLFMIATDRQKPWTVVLGAAVLLTVPLDIVLIPYAERTFANGALGGALAYIFTEIGITVVGLLLLKKGTLDFQNLWYALRVLAAGLLMVSVSWWSREIFIAVPILVGGASYILFLLLFRVVQKEDGLLLAGFIQSGYRKFALRKVQVSSTGQG